MFKIGCECSEELAASVIDRTDEMSGVALCTPLLCTCAIGALRITVHGCTSRGSRTRPPPSPMTLGRLLGRPAIPNAAAFTGRKTFSLDRLYQALPLSNWLAF